ncbi:hypothetical protein [Chroococcidiopsis sp. CCMEE 29]|uniref:hypothetical protein n=1 Tax=Chroococcidiopsis sp. CCMEE 29 TaxID=155894 RepID=UPI0020202748|nr:hypothetical protein [Chroococcidiopsis sp. CCMEE 29]
MAQNTVTTLQTTTTLLQISETELQHTDRKYLAAARPDQEQGGSTPEYTRG